jgi:signal-transduction protein with cAMP-binding, CBS, and nucleotidyltransferase domain
MALLLAKGEDFASWDGVEEFAVAYRDAAVALSSQRHPEGIPQMLELVETLLTDVEQKNSRVAEQLEEIKEKLAAATEQVQLRSLLVDFFDCIYGHFGRFRSPVAFFCMTENFLHDLAASCLRLAKQHVSGDLPPFALILMGPAGRREATRYSRLQLALVWDGQGEETETHMVELGEELVAWFRVSGIALEESITPLNHEWRGNLQQWQARFEVVSGQKDSRILIELLRLADTIVLLDEGNVAGVFTALCRDYLCQRKFVANLVERCLVLTNGIGMMGSLRLEKSGPHRGSFPLLDHAFLPLAAAIGALCLLHNVDLIGMPERLRCLVRLGKLDVDLGERVLNAWNCFSIHRLCLEQTASTGQDCRDILHLIPARLSSAELEQLRLSLEAVTDLQRHLQVHFGSYI